jgi:predicted metal-dependent HD superfamily phosphohydrolase
MDSNSIYKKVEQYVTDLFEDNKDDTLVFHNISHTKSVVNRTKEIAGHYNINERDMLVLFIAAWFHDTGHLFTKPVGHEDKSVEIVNAFMHDHFDDEELTQSVDECILATKAPRNPTNLLQEIICDADTYHFGTKEFKDTNKLVLKEIQLKNGYIDLPRELKGALTMLEDHVFYTSYCRELLEETKQKNIKKVKKKLNEVSEHEGKKSLSPIEKSAAIKKSLVIDKEKDLATKGIQTMLRLTSENQMKLSDMADHKANILISVNAIIISVILGVLMRRLQDDTYLTIPTIIFLVVAVVTIVIAILATRPKISNGTFSNQDILDKKTNLLFFGNFHRATYEDYDTAMRKMMKDSDYLYASLIKDIYMLGVVLGRKYRLIRLAYNIFMIGIVISVIAFGIAAILYGAESGAASTPSGSPL